MTAVRELNGVIAAASAQGGFAVTGGQFTREAREFAKGTPIALMDGDALQQLIGSVSPVPPASAGKVARRPAPACPRCGTEMVEREATRGQFVGKHF